MLNEANTFSEQYYEYHLVEETPIATTFEEKAKYIVFELMDDMRGRSGLENEWDQIDSDIQEEIFQEWYDKTLSILNK